MALVHHGLLDEVWLSRLAKATGISLDTSHKLWRAFLQQLEVRLSMGYALEFGALGWWSYILRDEYVACLDSGEQYLMPPRLELCLTSEINDELQPLPKSLLADSLSSLVDIPHATSAEWLANIETLAEELLRVGRELHFPEIGMLSPKLDDEGEVVGFSLSLSSTYEELVNKSFAMFSPVELLVSESAEGLERISVSSLDALAISRPLMYDWKGQQDVEPEESLSEKDEAASEIFAEEALDTERAIVEPPIALEVVPLAEHPVVGDDEEVDDEVYASQPTLLNREARSRNKWLSAFLLFGSVLVLMPILHYIRPRVEVPLSPLETPLDMQQVSVDPVMDSLKTIRGVDSLSVEVASVPTNRPKIEEISETEKKVISIDSSMLRRDNSSSAMVSETITLERGVGLMQISLKKYGDKVFWVYIYEENKSVIKDYNNIPLGTKLILPAARKYGINANDTNSRNRALALQRALLKGK